MKKNIILFIIIICLYGCSSKEMKEAMAPTEIKEIKQIMAPIEIKEVTAPVEIKLSIIENTEATNNIPINLKVIPLYEKNIQYTGNLPLLDYLFTNSNVNIRSKPSINGKILDKTEIREKIEILDTVKEKGEGINNNRIWYKVKNKNYIGYIHSSVAIRRYFRFEEMAKKARNLDLFIVKSKKNNWSIEKITEYNPGSSEEENTPVDKYGHRGEQSIRSTYIDSKGKNTFRYLSDGRIISIKNKDVNVDVNVDIDIDTDTDTDTDTEEYSITIPDSIETYKIEAEKSLKIDVGEGIDRVIVIDLSNQNQGIFLKKDGIWQLISYSLISSGRNNNKDSYETPKGYFLVGNTVKQVIFPYEKKVKKVNLGEEVIENITEKGIIEEEYEIVKKYSRANYGIRFSGGGYIHGIPLSDDIVEELGDEEAVKERKEKAESTLGTYKRSHKCVRTPEEHESFLYNDFVGYDPAYKDKWWRRPRQNVAVIVF